MRARTSRDRDDLRTEFEVLAASIRHPRHVTEAALAGAHIATVPLKVLRQMIHHPLTDSGILQFRKDWDAVQTAGKDRTTGGVKASEIKALRRLCLYRTVWFLTPRQAVSRPRLAPTGSARALGRSTKDCTGGHVDRHREGARYRCALQPALLSEHPA